MPVTLPSAAPAGAGSGTTVGTAAAVAFLASPDGGWATAHALDADGTHPGPKQLG